MKTIITLIAFVCLFSVVYSQTTCTLDSECGHGECHQDGISSDYLCVCDGGWINEPNTGDVCAYEQKSKLTAFLVSFFVGSLGVDWFYLCKGNAGYIIAGIIKLLLALCFTSSGKSKNKYHCGISVTCVGIWWLVDWIRILCNAFPDGDGQLLYGNM